MRKCEYCDKEMLYEQNSTNRVAGEPVHMSCMNEWQKRKFERKCIACGTDLAEDDSIDCDKCSGNYTGYPGI